MTLQIGILLALILISLVFFLGEWVSADVVALGLMLLLVLTELLPADKAFAGFGSDTVLLIFGLLVMAVALAKAGVVDIAGRAILKHAGQNPGTLVLVMMCTVALLSAFMSNTAATAFFVPLTIGVARRFKISPSKLLLPIAFASILSSSVTLISTSTNIVVSSLMKSAGLAEMGMFELAPVGIPIAVFGLLYTFFIGRRLLPEREPSTELIETFGVRDYLSEILVLEGSPLVGKTLADSGLTTDLELTLLRLRRDGSPLHSATGTTLLKAGDVLLVEAGREQLLKVKDIPGIEIQADAKFTDPSFRDEQTLLVEAILLPRSQLIGRSLKRARFFERYGVHVLAINRQGKNVIQKLSQLTLRMGDVLLLQGSKEAMTTLDEDPAFRILGAVENERFDRTKALFAVGIFVGAMLLAVLKIVPLPVAALLGAFCTLIARCISPEDAYRELEWKVVILIACMLSLGAAMEHTGADSYLAGVLVRGLGSLGPTAILAGFFVLTVALTQPMTNQGAAAVLLPVAVETATQIDANPRCFAMMIAIAASCSYLSPLEPSCLLVYGPGRYRFSDFLRVGAGLTLLIFVLAMLLVPVVWPLRLP